MTDLAAFKGLFHRQLGDVPTVLYCHENQFAYPLTPGVTASVEPRMVSLYSALAADRVIFNSHYNRTTFLEGARVFLARMPDRLPAAGLEEIVEKSDVIPVPVRDTFFQRRVSCAADPVTLIWNHRWEYDKGPDRLLTAMECLAQRGLSFRLCLAGQRFRQTPAPLRDLTTRFGPGVEDRGFLPVGDYQALLERGGWVLSTAVHDFQGLAVQEAAAAGCVPLVPDRLVYPEWFSESYRYSSHTDPVVDGHAMAEQLLAWAESGAPAPPSVDAFRLEVLAPRYREVFNSLV